METFLSNLLSDSINYVYNFYQFSWKRHETETPSALLAFWWGESPVNVGFPSQGASDVERWRFLCFQPEQAVYMMTSSNGNIFRVTGHLCG